MTVPSTAGAQLLKKIGAAIGSVAETGVRMATAPTEALVNTGRVIVGDAKPSQIYKPYQDLARSAGQSVATTTTAVTEPQRFMYERAQAFAEQTGPVGAFIFDAGTFAQRYMGEFGAAGLYATAGVLQGQNVFEVAAAPLAAGLRAAHARHTTSARPLPEDVKAGLRPYFPASTLERARYAVGRVEITLPNFIGRGQKIFGDDYAVVTDDIIVFNGTPPSFAEGAFWWAHEVKHVQQYEALGYEGFAYRYLRDLGQDIEREADAAGQQATGGGRVVLAAAQMVGGPAPGGARSVDMTGAPDQTNYRTNPEVFVAQCVFPRDRYPVQYLVTNYGRIIVVDPASGQWLHLGFATPPLLPKVAWTYQTPNVRYAVMGDGAILTAQPVLNQWGQPVGEQWVQVGHVIRLR